MVRMHIWADSERLLEEELASFIDEVPSLKHLRTLHFHAKT